MSLAETGFAVLDEFLKDPDWDHEGYNSGAFRGVIPFEYKGLEYVIKFDLNEDDYGDDYYGSCRQEFDYWEKYKDTKHRQILCPVLEFGSYDAEIDWLIMPRLLHVQDFAKERNPEHYKIAFDTILVPYVKKLYPKLTTDYWRIYLPNNLFGEDLHYSNWGYDPYSKRWLILDYAGDDAEEDHEWDVEYEMEVIDA